MRVYYYNTININLFNYKTRIQAAIEFIRSNKIFQVAVAAKKFNVNRGIFRLRLKDRQLNSSNYKRNTRLFESQKLALY